MRKVSTFRLNFSTEPGSKVGYIRRAHGIRGAVVIRVVDDELGRMTPGSVLLTDNKKYPEVTLLTVQPHPDGLLVAIEGVDDRNAAEDLRGASLLVAERRELDPDEFWPDQLIGLVVVSPAGGRLGVVADLVAGSAQDRLVVATDDGQAEVPFVAALVLSIDLDAGQIVVDPPQGLFPA